MYRIFFSPHCQLPTAICQLARSLPMSNSLSTTHTTSNTSAPTPQSESRYCTPANIPAKSARSPRPLSERDLDIYKRVKITGYQQWEVAQEMGLHKSRVSQIVVRVARWLAAGGQATDPLIREHAARNRLSRGNLKLRLNRAIEIATSALEFNLPVKTTRRRIQGVTEVWREETSRDVPGVNHSALRLLVTATKSLQQLEQDDTSPQRERGTSDSTTPHPSDEELLRTIFDFLCGCRYRAESLGRLPPSENIPALVAQTLAPLLGLPPTDLPSHQPEAQARGPATNPLTPTGSVRDGSPPNPPSITQLQLSTTQLTVSAAQLPSPSAKLPLEFSALSSASIDTTLAPSITSNFPPEQSSAS